MRPKTSYRGMIGALLSLIIMGTAFASCSSLVYDDTDDCQTNLRLKFMYDYNMKFADAFANEVKTVHLYAYDESGVLVLDKTATVSGSDYTMDVNELKSGVKYDFYVWAEGTKRTDTWAYGPSTSATSLTATLSESGSTVENDITPLFYGSLTGAEFASRYGTTQTITIPLIKDTNNVIVTLAEQNGESLNPSDYTFTITDAVGNTHFNYDNTPAASGSVTYSPWMTYQGEVNDKETRSTTLSAVLAEFTLSRLMADRSNKDVRLVVTNNEGYEVINIPFIDCLLLTKGYYNREMSDQEYLDREDSYKLTFFITEGKWISAAIYINSWRVVYQSKEL